MTSQQEAIYDAIRDSKSHLVIQARAGTGKTTTAVGCLSQGLGGKVGFVAFNRHIAEELKSRLPPEVTACTLHTLGMTAVQRAFPSVKLDQNRMRTLAQQLSPGAKYPLKEAAIKLCRMKKLTCGTESSWGDLVDTFDIDTSECEKADAFTLAEKLYHSSMDTDAYDFDDMLWLPLVHGLAVDQFDLLCVDEAQDLNPTQQQLAKAAISSGRLVAIGDSRQAIYGFAGADCKALQTLRYSLDPCEELPLTVTWRCPSSHVVLARKICQDLEAAPTAIEGVIDTQTLDTIVESAAVGDLVIARKNRPLVSLTYKLILAGKPALMRGREIGQGLKTLVNRLRPDTVDDLEDKLYRFRDREIRRMDKAGCPESTIQAMEDKVECLSTLSSQMSSVDELTRWIDEHFDENPIPGESIVLSSIHRAKGLEADRVFVLDTSNLPLSHKRMKLWQQEQERNLAYIAATRSKSQLIFENQVPLIFS